jgi:hypothetical protein
VHWPNPTETQAEVLKGGLKGAIRGGAVGGLASIVSGAAVIVTTPAWVPWIGGSLVVAATTIAAWSVVGSGAGALTGGTWAYVRTKQQERRFRNIFNQKKPTS